MDRTNTPFPIFVVDDGSTEEDKINLLKELDSSNKVFVIRQEHKGYKPQFLEIMKIFKDVPYYIFMEDDVVFSKNWYQWGCRNLQTLIAEGYNIGVFALYTGHPALKEQVLPNVYRHNTEHFYGTCCLFINPKIIDEYEYQAKTWNPDVAIREMSLNRSEFLLFVASPTLAQHIGRESLLGAPPHRSGLFWGQDKDALTL